MKKLMVIVAVAMAAIVSQAATFKWSTTSTGKIYEAGTTTLLASGTAYFFDQDVVSQASLVTAFAGGKLDLSKQTSVDSNTISVGALAGKVATYGEVGTQYTFYLAVLTDDGLYIGPTKAVYGLEGKDSAVSFSAKTSSQAAALDASAGYAGAGWYAAVPEPTSGLLMLLGIAGLALRRRRA